MSLGGFIRRVGYHINDYINNPKGTRIHPQWREIEAILSSFDKGWPIVEEKLQCCLNYATDNSDFYKTFKGKPLNQFPVLTKLDFIEHYDSIRSKEFLNQPLHTSSTSGSTGTPFKVIQDKAKRNRVLAELQYWGG